MKLLSFNASIEAAKADKFGRGFGVVALEIKESSNKAKTVANTIGEINSKNKEIVNDFSEVVNALMRGFQIRKGR